MPEYNDFESLENTDLVNIPTGGMSYNIPVMTVPGPAMGFPLVLNYHGGITPRQEATMVGLGWNLQAGAITRQVNNTPDDFKGDLIEELLPSQRIHGWMASISYNMATVGVSWDSENGYGGLVGISLNLAGLGVSVTSGWNGVYDGVGLTLSAGVSVMGGPDQGNSGLSGTGSAGVSIGVHSKRGVSAGAYANLSVAASVPTTKDNPNLNVGLGSMGISLSNKGVSGSASPGVSFSSSITNSRNTQSTSSSGAMMVWTPIGYFSLNWGTWSWTSDGLKEDRYYGFLYANDLEMGCSSVDINCHKLYAHDFKNESVVSELLSVTQRRIKKIEVNEAEKVIWGLEFDHFKDENNGFVPSNIQGPLRIPKGKIAATAEDIYSVATQGISGMIKPYRGGDGEYYTSRDPIDGEFASGCKSWWDATFRGSCPQKVNVDLVQLLDVGRTRHSHINNLKDKVHWRFMNDQGGSFYLDPENSPNGPTVAAASKKITPYYKFDKLIGWRIIKEDGTVYLYTKPQVNYFSKQIASANEDGSLGTSRVTPPYAYAWLLTAILAPDYVKRRTTVAGEDPDCIDFDQPIFSSPLDPVCLPQDDDIGGWVRFNYGNHKKVSWISPFQKGKILAPTTFDGKRNNDDTHTPKSYSVTFGMKGVDYLTEVHTPTHKAVLAYSEREDGFGAHINSVFENSWVPIFDYTKVNSTNSEKVEGEDKVNETMILESEIPDNSIFENFYNISPGSPVNSLKLQSRSPRAQGCNFNGWDIEIPNYNINDKIKVENSVSQDEGSGGQFHSHWTLYKNNIKYADDLEQEDIKFEQHTEERPICTEGYYLSRASVKVSYPLHGPFPNIDQYWGEKLLKLDRINLKSKIFQEETIGSVKFDYDYSLAQNTPNATSGKLTLLGVKQGASENGPWLPPYQFDYSNNHPFASRTSETNKVDKWGYYCASCNEYKKEPDGTSNAWNLNKIINPSGAKTTIEYEAGTIEYLEDHPILFPGPEDFSKLVLSSDDEDEVWVNDQSGECTATSFGGSIECRQATFSEDEPHVNNFKATIKTLNPVVKNWLQNQKAVLLGTFYGKEVDKKLFMDGPVKGASPQYYLVEKVVGGSFTINNVQVDDNYVGADLLKSGNTAYGIYTLAGNSLKNLVVNDLNNDDARLRLWAIYNGDPDLTYYGGGVRVKKVSFSDPITSQVNETEYVYSEGATPVLPQSFSTYLTDFYRDDLTGERLVSGNPSVIYGKVSTKFNSKYQIDYKFLTSRDMPNALRWIDSRNVGLKTGQQKLQVVDNSPFWASLVEKVESTIGINGTVKKETKYYKANTLFMETADYRNLTHVENSVYNQLKKGVSLKDSEQSLEYCEGVDRSSIPGDNPLHCQHSLAQHPDYTATNQYFGSVNKVYSHRYFIRDCMEPGWAFGVIMADHWISPENYQACLENQNRISSTQIEWIERKPYVVYESVIQDDVIASNFRSHYDFLTGMPLLNYKVKDEPSNLRPFFREMNFTVPAYYVDDEMKEKNMLTQPFSITNYRVPPEEHTINTFNAGKFVIDYKTEQSGNKIISLVGRTDPTATPQELAAAIALGKNYVYKSVVQNWDNYPVSINNFTAIRKKQEYEWYKPTDNTGVGFEYPGSKEITNIDQWTTSGKNAHYDDFGHIIDFELPNGVHNSRTYGYRNSLPTSFVQNATKDEIFYESFETVESIPPVNSSKSSKRSKTGLHSLEITGNSFVCIDVPNVDFDRTYRASAWYYDEFIGSNFDDPSDPTIRNRTVDVTRPGIYLGGRTGTTYCDNSDQFHPNGATIGTAELLGVENSDPRAEQRAGGTRTWKKISAEFNPSKCQFSDPNIEICLYASRGKPGSNVFFDELRLHPVNNSFMATTTYNSDGDISSSADHHGVVTWFEYDKFGNLTGIRDDDGILLSEQSKRFSIEDIQANFVNKTVSDEVECQAPVFTLNGININAEYIITHSNNPIVASISNDGKKICTENISGLAGVTINIPEFGREIFPTITVSSIGNELGIIKFHCKTGNFGPTVIGNNVLSSSNINQLFSDGEHCQIHPEIDGFISDLESAGYTPTGFGVTINSKLTIPAPSEWECLGNASDNNSQRCLNYRNAHVRFNNFNFTESTDNGISSIPCNRQVITNAFPSLDIQERFKSVCNESNHDGNNTIFLPLAVGDVYENKTGFPGEWLPGDTYVDPISQVDLLNTLVIREPYLVKEFGVSKNELLQIFKNQFDIQIKAWSQSGWSRMLVTNENPTTPLPNDIEPGITTITIRAY